MFMVLALHVNFFALGAPSSMDLHNNPINALSRSYLEIICMGAVDLFVLISGWFGIRPSRKGFLKFFFQSFFFITLVNIIGVLTSNVHGERLIFDESFLFSHAWFVVAYAGLFIVSPVLNTFIKNTSYRTFKITIVSFFTFQTLYGCLSDSSGFNQGYSIISFIGLYLLGRFAKIHHYSLAKYGKWIILVSLSICISIYTAIAYLNLDYLFINLSIGYTSPFIIAAMLGVVMWASTIKPFHSKIINFIASSAFSVYLLHVCNKWSASLFKRVAIGIYDRWSGIEYIGVIFGFMVSIYLLAIIIDQVRKLAWKLLTKTTVISKILK